MRALLVVNPMATATTSKARDVLARALASDLKVDVAQTTHRGHAADLAAQAMRDGVDLVVALGGDGTVNEVVNGLLAAGPGAHVPALAVVPGGSTNVFSRSIGQSRDPVEATAEILAAVREDRSARISLGRADDRWFTFAAGFGYDAQVVHRVERRRAKGGESTAALYIRTAVARFYLGSGRLRPAISLTVPGQEPVGPFFLCVASNTAPWTYIGSVPVNLSPQASFDAPLEILAVRRTGTARMLRYITQALRHGPGPAGPSLVRLHRVPELVLTASRPTSFQVDGDYLGELEQVRLTSTPAALRVIC
ncbi:diacylglycerol kinase family protein [soil metagenome]